MHQLARYTSLRVFAVVILLLTAQWAYAATLTVTSISDSGSGSLRQALMDAVDGDTLDFDLAYPATISLTSGQLEVDGSITIVGPGADRLTIARSSSAPDFRIFYIAPGNNVGISGLTVMNGSDPFGGAGIYNLRSTLTLERIRVSNNTTGNIGGGIVNDGVGSGGSAILTIEDSTIDANSAGWGGGILNLGEASGSATMTIRNSSIVGNTAFVDGAGLRNSGQHNGNASVEVISCQISNNSAGFRGGGIYNVTIETGDQPGVAVLAVAESTVSSNRAHQGSGISNIKGTASVTGSTVGGNSLVRNSSAPFVGGGLYSSGSATISTSTINNNWGGDDGGGIFSDVGSPLNVTNSTVSGNSANQGGGITSNRALLSLISSTVTNNSVIGGGGGIRAVSGGTLIRNSIIAGNSGGGWSNDAEGAFFSQGYNLVGDAGISVGFFSVGDQAGTTDAPINAGLGPLQDNGGPTFTHALQPGSPAIDAGHPILTGSMTTDQRGTGFARVVNDRIDIGAFEVQPPVTVCPLPQGYWKDNAGSWPITELTLGSETYSREELMAILTTPVGRARNADASIILSYQLIAAKLNIANGADGSEVLSTIAAADSLLTSFAGSLPFGVAASSTNGRLMTEYGRILDVFNNGVTTIGCVV